MQYSEKAKFDYLNETNQIGVNVWLIRVVSDEGRKQLKKILESSPLRFDSQLYEFYEQKSGKSIFMISILQQRIFISIIFANSLRQPKFSNISYPYLHYQKIILMLSEYQIFTN